MIVVQMSDTDESLAVMTVTKLLLSAEHYVSVSPALSRFYMLEAERLKKKLHLPSATASQICPYCCLTRRPDNCTRRLRSKMNSSRQIGRLERKIVDGGTVGKFAKSLIDRLSVGANRLQIRCHGCRKRTFVQGASRPAKVPKLPDLSAPKNSQVQLPRKKKTKRNRKSDAKVTDVVCVEEEMKQKSLDKRQSVLTPLHHEGQPKSKMTNKKETLKQKHNMLQNILKRKTNAASSDTSSALRTFLVSL